MPSNAKSFSSIRHFRSHFYAAHPGISRIIPDFLAAQSFVKIHAPAGTSPDNATNWRTFGNVFNDGFRIFNPLRFGEIQLSHFLEGRRRMCQSCGEFLTVMRCPECENLYRSSPDGDAHAALVQDGPDRKLRPMLKRPVRLAYYQCSACSTWWLHEQDPRSDLDGEWTLIGKERSILQPQHD